jgi:hypothetical protein
MHQRNSGRPASRKIDTARAHDGAVIFGKVGLERIDVGGDGDCLCVGLAIVSSALVGSVIVCPALGEWGGREVRVQSAIGGVAGYSVLTQIALIRAVTIEKVRDRHGSSSGGRIDPHVGDFTGGRDRPLWRGLAREAAK